MNTTTISLIFSAISIIFVIITFATNRKDKTNSDVGREQYKMGVLENKVDNISKQLDKILVKLDGYDKEIDEKVARALEEHVKVYHKGE